MYCVMFVLLLKLLDVGLLKVISSFPESGILFYMCLEPPLKLPYVELHKILYSSLKCCTLLCVCSLLQLKLDINHLEGQSGRLLSVRYVQLAAFAAAAAADAAAAAAGVSRVPAS